METPEVSKMLIKVKVKAGAKKEIIEKNGVDALLVSVKEKAVGDFANFRVRQIVSEQYGVPIEKVRMIRGHQIPNKIFEVLDT